MQGLDPHQRPPDKIRNVYKKYQKMGLRELDQDPDVVDFSSENPASSNSKVRLVKQWKRDDLEATFRAFAGIGCASNYEDLPQLVPVYEHADMPGLHIAPTLLPPEIQSLLLDRLLHRDLSNPSHLTNIHTHYHVSYPPSSQSFFSYPSSSPSPIATPLDPTVHKPLSIAQLLNKKMRWTTLGGQYNWTAKRYPDSPPPPFPEDIKGLLEGLFTETKAEAAIVNLYSPGDTLSVHRDVAETSETGLVSVSLGCDAIFIIGISKSPGDTHDGEDRESVLVLRLRSGSAVYMSGDSRFAWHGVPQIVGGTCPEFLRNWPGGPADKRGDFNEWKGWMAGKRVNLNVRQMWD